MIGVTYEDKYMNLFELKCIEALQQLVKDLFAGLECKPNFRTPFKE